VTRVILALLLAGFLYSGRATAIRYYEILQSPPSTGPSATIDSHLKPARVLSGELRAAVLRAGWSTGDDILLLASASSLSVQELYQVYYSAGYLLYPSRVWIAAWCDPAASSTQCESLGAQTPASAVSRHGVRQVLLAGQPNPFPGAKVEHINGILNAVTLP
jgi:hypothetical protein